jgi:hypothetical protein
MGFIGSMVAQSFFSAVGGFDRGTADEGGSDPANAEEHNSEAQLADGGDSFDDGGDLGDFDA